MTQSLQSKKWLLPAGITEMLPKQAAQVEMLRRELLDRYQSWGYELVMPPLIEYLDSLLTGAGNHLDLETFKLTDQLSGRMLGVRADITPQAARIDAHQLKRDVPVRLCYLGDVLKTKPDGYMNSRCPLQIGVELYGHQGADSDVEVLMLMMETLAITQIENVHLDIGHVGIFRGLAKQAGLSAKEESVLFEALQRKAVPEIETLIAQFDTANKYKVMLRALCDLNGGIEVLEKADAVLINASSEVKVAFENLKEIAQSFTTVCPAIPLHYDLAELRAYGYQTGVVFAAFIPGHGQEIARGGRYDDIGKGFGRSRPATGFSADLIGLMELGHREVVVQASGIYAPALKDDALLKLINKLRSQGEKVVVALPGQPGGAREMACDRELVMDNEQWVVINIT